MSTRLNDILEVVVVKSIKIISTSFTITILWLISSLMGLIVLGVFPATKAIIILLDDNDVVSLDNVIIKEYLSIYKKQFRKSNIVGYMILIISLILQLNSIIVIDYFNINLSFLYNGINLFVFVLFIGYLFYENYYELNTKDVIYRIALLIMVQPVTIILSVFWIIFCIMLSMQLIVIAPLIIIGLNIIGLKNILSQGKMFKKIRTN